MPGAGVIPANILGIYRATELRRNIAEETGGIVPFDADLPVHFEEDVVSIALPIPECDHYWQVPRLDDESPMRQFSIADGIQLLREKEPRPRRSYTYALVMKGNPSTKPFPLCSYCYGRCGTVILHRPPYPRT